MGLPCTALLGLGLLAALTAADLTPYSNCGFTGAMMGLQLGDCHEWPCILTRGKPVKVEVLFKAVWSYRALKTTINALFGGIAIPLYVDDQMCEGLSSGKCPADMGESLSYLANITVSHDLPCLTVTFEWSITNGEGDTVVCAQVPAQFH